MNNFFYTGVGAPSKVTREELNLVDVLLPTAFCEVSKQCNVKHVSLLTAVGADINAKGSWLTGTSAG